MTRPLAEVVRSPKIARRRRAVRWERLRANRRRLVAGAVLSALIVGAWALVSSPLFALEGIEVSGTSLLSRDEVIEASGLRLGMNLLGVRTGAVAERLERLTVVRDATVARIYPSKVRILVEERTPVAIVDTDWGLWLADSTGELIARPPPARTLGVPRVRIFATPRGNGVREALRLLVALPGADRAKAIQIDATDPTALAAMMGGVRVVFGSPDNVEAKLRALAMIVDRARAEGRRVIQVDVRVHVRPAARFA